MICGELRVNDPNHDMPKFQEDIPALPWIRPRILFNLIYICNSIGPKLVQFETNIIGKLQHNKLEFSLLPKKRGTTPRKSKIILAFLEGGSFSRFPGLSQWIPEITKPRVPGTFTSVDLKTRIDFDDCEDDSEPWWFGDWCLILMIVRMVLVLDFGGFPLLFHPEMLKSGKWSLTSESPS